jgi:steroid delta-isomerase-like uncharacterized protein
MKTIITVLAPMAIGVAIAFGACTNMGMKNNATDNRVAMNKAGMQKFFDEVFNKHNPAMFDSCVTADYVEHDEMPGVPATREGTKKIFQQLFAAYPDINIKVNFMVADTSYVTAQFTMSGTNSGSWMGMPPTNKKFSIDGVDIVRFVNGKGVEHWGYRDDMKMMQQLGMMPDMNSSMPSDSAMKKMTEDMMNGKGKNK